MNRMNITKSAFMEMIRCRRFPALHHIYKRRDFDDDTMDRYYELVEGLGSFDEDLIKDDLEHLQVMMPYFEQIEVLAARRILAEWPGKTRYGTQYGSQKLFIRDYDNFNLMCYVDIYNKDNSQINIIEVKATTSNKFFNLMYKDNKIEYNVFTLDEYGVLHLNEEYDRTLLDHPKYMKQRNKLFDRFNDIGIYVYDLAFQRFVIEADQPDAKYFLGVLNHEYVFDGTYFDSKPVYTNDIIRFVDLTKITKEMQPIIERDLQVVIERIKEDDESPTRLGKHCQLKKQRECMFKDICYHDFPATNSILQYIDKHHGFKSPSGDKYDVFDLIEEGSRTMADIPHDWLHRRNNQIQRDVAITGKPYINSAKIQAGIEEIEYPIYHLDFESFPCPLPRFKGEKAYTQSLFQFSLHIEREPGFCDKFQDHFEYLSPNHQDNRDILVRELCNVIPVGEGSVLVYNQAFERTRINELAELFPEYANHLHNINERLFDLMHIVKTNSSLYTGLGFDEEQAKTVNFYDQALAGSYSIKKVLPIFSELSYKNMPVGNGMEAVYAYASFPKLGETQLAETKQALVQYCQQDTWAMVEILAALRKI